MVFYVKMHTNIHYLQGEKITNPVIRKLDADWKKYVAQNSKIPYGIQNKMTPYQMKIPRNINGNSFHYKGWHKPGYDVDANSWVPMHRNHLSDSANTKKHQSDKQFTNALTGIYIQ